MSETDFEVGMVVKLKSGGPEMTIKAFDWDAANNSYYTDRVECTWFDKDDNLKIEKFKTILLSKIE